MALPPPEVNPPFRSRRRVEEGRGSVCKSTGDLRLWGALLTKRALTGQCVIIFS
jgi:hypothetical protein